MYDNLVTMKVLNKYTQWHLLSVNAYWGCQKNNYKKLNLM